MAILRHLEQVSGYTANASILRDVLNGVGVGSTFDQVTTELAWLQEVGMVTMIDHGDFVIAEATRRGIEVARGEAPHPDVQRPSARRL
ncbi:MAG: hypothetical protein VR71_10110 [Roseovarius sp. BRH_c41]|nr:MAG: hypothetical protein VR71_10110 [Roseovarius sp. BRH_c41]